MGPSGLGWGAGFAAGLGADFGLGLALATDGPVNRNEEWGRTDKIRSRAKFHLLILESRDLENKKYENLNS